MSLLYPQPFMDIEDLHFSIYEKLAEICDPEFNQTLEELNVISEDNVILNNNDKTSPLSISITFKPTVPHCSFASLIGLTIIYAIYNTINEINFSPSLPSHVSSDEAYKYVKVSVCLQPGSHQSENQLNKQLNDKERVACALSNPTLLNQVQKLTSSQAAMH